MTLSAPTSLKTLLALIVLLGVPAGKAMAQSETANDTAEAAPVTSDTAIPDPALEPDTALFPVLETLRGGDKNLSYDYLGERLGLHAWLLSGPELMQIVYTRQDMAGAMLGGALIGADGKEISSELTRHFLENYPERAQEILLTVRHNAENKSGDAASGDAATADTGKTSPVSSPSERLWQRLHQSGKIAFGATSGAPVVFAILDPVQKESAMFWAKIKPLLDQKTVTLYVLPLGVTNADSLLEIAAVLGADDTAQAWEKLMTGQSVVPKGPTDTKGVLGMQANVELAQSLKLRDVPFLVYRGENGKVRLLSGLPKQWDDFLREIAR